MNERETLLLAWMNMSMRIRGNRLLKTLSFNEMLALSILRRAEEQQQPALTAAAIGNSMRLHKSEMNKLFSGLVAKQLILRQPSQQDKRKIELHLNPDHLSVYQTEHENVMRYLDRIAEKLGVEQTVQLAHLLQMATDAVDEEANKP